MLALNAFKTTEMASQVEKQMLALNAFKTTEMASSEEFV